VKKRVAVVVCCTCLSAIAQDKLDQNRTAEGHMLDGV
jgi:hypothetical protein